MAWWLIFLCLGLILPYLLKAKVLRLHCICPNKRWFLHFLPNLINLLQLTLIKIRKMSLSIFGGEGGEITSNCRNFESTIIWFDVWLLLGYAYERLERDILAICQLFSCLCLRASCFSLRWAMPVANLQGWYISRPACDTCSSPPWAIRRAATRFIGRSEEKWRLS